MSLAAVPGAPAIAGGEAAAEPPILAGSGPSAATRRQLRGSSLLLAGRLLSKGSAFIIQVLIVRYLSKSTYGAFAYALSYVALGETIATFGLDRAVTRFAPIYHERRDYPRLFGTLALVLGTVLVVGLGVVLFFWGPGRSFVASSIDDPQVLPLLAILILLVPVQAFDALLVGLFAVFSNPRAIFFRKYMLAPALRLGVVLLLIASGSGPGFLALGYVAAGLVGVLVSLGLLVRLTRAEGLWDHFDRHAVSVPAREVLGFTVPLLSSDMVYVVMGWLTVWLLGYFHGTDSVASLRVVVPAAQLNQLVLASFGMLFTPAAARMFARHDREAINGLYWRNAIWIAVVSFPVFALTFSLAGPLTVALFGPEYASSAPILALLAFGYYFNAALGQNGLTLKVFGRVRYVVVLNVLTALVTVAVSLVLIPRFGALGAAVGTCTTLVVFNLLKQAGLALGTGVSLFEWRYVRVYLIIALAALGLLALTRGADFGLVATTVIAALASLAVVWLNRGALQVADTYPELLRLPGARLLFGAPTASGAGVESGVVGESGAVGESGVELESGARGEREGRP